MNYNPGASAGVGILSVPPINSPLTAKVQVTDSRRKQIYKKVKPEDDDVNELLLTENVVVPVNNKTFDAMAIQFNDEDEDDDDNSSISSNNIEEILETPPRTPHGNNSSSPIKLQLLVTSTDSEPVLLRSHKNKGKGIKASDPDSVVNNTTSPQCNLISNHPISNGNLNGGDSNILDEIIDMMFETGEPVVCKKPRMDFDETPELGNGNISNTSSIVGENKHDEEIEIEPNIGQIMEDMANSYFNQPEGHEMNFDHEQLFPQYSLDGFRKLNDEDEKDDIPTTIAWSGNECESYDHISQADNRCGDQEEEEETNIYNTPPPTNPSSPPELIDSSSSCSTSSFFSNPMTDNLKSPSFHSFGTSFFEELEELRKQQSTDSIAKPKENMDIFNLESEDIISTILESEELIDSEQLKKGLINTLSNVGSDNDDTMDLDLNENEPSIQDIMKADCMWSSMKLQKIRTMSCSSTDSETNNSQVLNENSIDMSINGNININNNSCNKLLITEEVKNKIIKSKNEELDYLRTTTTLDHPYCSLQSVDGVVFEDDNKDETQCMLTLNDVLMDENEAEAELISTGEAEDEDDDKEEEESESEEEDDDDDDESVSNKISISAQKLKEILFGGDSQEVTINQTFDGKTKSTRLVIQSKNALIQQMLATANGRKTKILVPLKDLCSTLEHKSFQVTPIGPGKKVIKLTGSGETVANVLHNVVNSSNGNLLNKISIIECNASAKNKPETVTRSPNKATSAELLNLFCQSGSNNLNLNDKKPKYVTLTTNGPSKAKEKETKSFIVKSNSHKKKYTQTQLQKEKIDAAVNAAVASSADTGKKKDPAIKGLIHHNNSERLRRSDLKNAFEILKGMIPIIDKNKAPKVEILRRAHQYIKSLKAEDSKFTVEMNQEKQRSEMLKQTMKQLSNSK